MPQTIVIPTRHEEASVAELCQRIAAVAPLQGLSVCFVDDSDSADAMQKAISCAGNTHNNLNLSMRWRDERTRTGGLSGAVVHGIGSCDDDFVVVMDGDCQHPPELLPAMLTVAKTTDVVIASRYIRGGNAGGLDGPLRHIVSRASTYLAKILFPWRLRKVSDPMTGFFVIRRSAVDLSRLKPDGFKILLEILTTHADLRIVELPLEFAKREAGTSKGNLKQGLLFLRQLQRLRLAV